MTEEHNDLMSQLTRKSRSNSLNLNNFSVKNNNDDRKSIASNNDFNLDLELDSNLDMGIDKLMNKDILKSLSNDNKKATQIANKVYTNNNKIPIKSSSININGNDNYNDNDRESSYRELDGIDMDVDYNGINNDINNNEMIDLDSIKEYQFDTDNVDNREPMSRFELLTEKRNELTLLERLVQKGYEPIKMFGMSDKLSDIKNERMRLQKQKELNDGVKSARSILIKFSMGCEFANKYYNPYKFNLDGFSENVMENITDYDDVFEELYLKYGSSVPMYPEVKLLFIFISSAITFHISKIAMSKASSQIPGFNEVMDADPKLRRMYEESANKLVKEKGKNSDISNILGGSTIGNLFGGLFTQNNTTNQQTYNPPPQPAPVQPQSPVQQPVFNPPQQQGNTLNLTPPPNSQNILDSMDMNRKTKSN
jgi:hypothetical protein